MSYERSTQSDLLEAYERNHGQLVQVMGELQATIAANYRNDIRGNPNMSGSKKNCTPCC